jgi:3-phenylpropionate/cinnamic acid dioxygenase small subunit
MASVDGGLGRKRRGSVTETLQAARASVGADLYLEILRFLYHESDLLDQRRYDEWVELLDEEIEYRMPLTLTRERSEQARAHSTSMEYFCENIASIRLRIARLSTEYAWAEDPPTRTRHLVSNVRVEPTADEQVLRIDAVFCVYANRGPSTEYDLFVGSREDLLVRREGSWKLLKRTLYLDQATLGASSISIFL